MRWGEKKQISIQSIKTQRLLADKCVEAVRFTERLRGLIGRESLLDGEGMYFPSCNSIHMWFMSIPIDVVFVRKKNGDASRIVEVLSVFEDVKPWRVLPVSCWKADDVIELPVGIVRENKIQVGDLLCIV